MPPRLNILNFARPIAFRPKPQVQWLTARLSPSQLRMYSDSKDPLVNDRSKKPETKPLDDVSTEARKVADITCTAGPEVEQGTPVQELLKNDKEAQAKLPKVMRDALNKSSNSGPKGTRSYSTTTTPIDGPGALDLGLVDLDAASKAVEIPGVKFGLPTLPLPKTANHKTRYDPVVEQVTNLMMRHGQKSVAQRNMALILQQLRTSNIPTINPQRPLVPGAPPPSHLPLNPVLYLTLAIDSIAPLLRIRSQKGAAGGGAALQIPVPLGQRQRRRTAIMWILNSASKRKHTGSGKGSFAQRVAAEIISVVEGRSSVWERRNAIHKLGVSARANIVLPRRR